MEISQLNQVASLPIRLTSDYNRRLRRGIKRHIIRPCITYMADWSMDAGHKTLQLRIFS